MQIYLKNFNFNSLSKPFRLCIDLREILFLNKRFLFCFSTMISDLKEDWFDGACLYKRNIKLIIEVLASDRPFVAIEPKNHLLYREFFLVELFRDEIDHRIIAFYVQTGFTRLMIIPNKSFNHVKRTISLLEATHGPKTKTVVIL